MPLYNSKRSSSKIQNYWPKKSLELAILYHHPVEFQYLMGKRDLTHILREMRKNCFTSFYNPTSGNIHGQRMAMQPRRWEHVVLTLWNVIDIEFPFLLSAYQIWDISKYIYCTMAGWVGVLGPAYHISNVLESKGSFGIHNGTVSIHPCFRCLAGCQNVFTLDFGVN